MKRSRLTSSVRLKKKGRIAIVASLFNEEICHALVVGAEKALVEVGWTDDKILVVRVPGAFEIPLVAKKLAASKKYQAVICLGAVIRGDTPHFDYVCQGVTSGVMQAGLETGVPILFGVITTNTLEQALERARDDTFNKGRDAALAAVDMISVLEKI